MTEQDILDAITNAGWTVIQTKEDSTSGDRIVYSVWCTQVINDGVVDKYFRYVKYPDDSCYWWEKDPFPAPKPESFQQKLQTAITNLITAGTIKAGYVEKSDLVNETALVVVITPSDAYKTFLVNKNASGNLQPTEIAGDYPMRSSTL
jgi:hypothetical protein